MARPNGTKKISTPEILWEHFLAYKKQVKSNPRKKMVFGGKDFTSDFELLERPLTIEGFENYCFEKNIISDLGKYFANTNGDYEDYRTTCSHIKQQIRQDQIEGGMVGQYNPSITQRLNGLKEQSDVTIKEQPLF